MSIASKNFPADWTSKDYFDWAKQFHGAGSIPAGLQIGYEHRPKSRFVMVKSTSGKIVIYQNICET